MTEAEFCGLVEEIVTTTNAEALWVRLSPYFERVDEVVDQARYVQVQWLAGELTRRNGMNQLEKVLNALEYG